MGPRSGDIVQDYDRHDHHRRRKSALLDDLRRQKLVRRGVGHSGGYEEHRQSNDALDARNIFPERERSPVMRVVWTSPAT